MSSGEGTRAVFACDLHALTSGERARQQESRLRLEQGTDRVVEEAEGYRFEYAADVAPITVAAWVELERKCCPFLRFTIDIPEHTGPLRLHVSGTAGVKAFLSSEMKIENQPPNPSSDRKVGIDDL